MISLDVVHSRNAALAATHSVVAVVVGGTAGIGEGTVRTLARTYSHPDSKHLRVYIVGRNKAAADATITYCQNISKGQFIFVQAQDLSLLKDVDRCGAEIIAREEAEASKLGETPRIDFLVETQYILTFEGRRDTPEGLDTTMCLLYYGRTRFIFALLPLLTASSLPTGARVVSVRNPNLEGEMFLDDLSVRNPKHYGFATRMHLGSMITLMHEEIVKRTAGSIGICHVYPGFVPTGGIDKGRLSWWMRWLWKGLIGPLLSLWKISVEECGERTLFLLSGRFPARGVDGKGGDGHDVAVGSDGVVGSGAYKVDSQGGVIATSEKCNALRKEGVAEKVWEHTMEAFKEIEAGRVFSG